MKIVASILEGGRGASVAATLAGAWRRVPAPADFPPGAGTRIIPFLLETGAAGLVWRRLSDTDKARPEARPLRLAYRHHLLEAAVHERRIADLATLLSAAGVEPLLVKGWAVASLYPEPGLRPYSDIDLSVRPDQIAATAAVLTNAAGRCGWADLHAGVPDLSDRTWGQLIAHSRLAQVGAATVRVLGPEDQLRHLCTHLLRHGAWRPLWLCDVAAALEARPADFDWDYFHSGDRRRSQWAVNVLALACRLLGAEAPTPAVARTAIRMRWLPQVVLREWSGGFVPHHRARPLPAFRRDPAGWFGTAASRMNMNPIECLAGLPSPPLAGWPAPAVGFVAMLARTLRFVRWQGKAVRPPVRPAHCFDLHIPPIQQTATRAGGQAAS